MRKEAATEMDSALSSLSFMAENAKVMLWELTQGIFVWNDADEHSCEILYEYEYAAVKARIAEDYVLKMIDEIEELKQIVSKCLVAERAKKGE